jgi:hypothetical protein
VTAHVSVKQKIVENCGDFLGLSRAVTYNVCVVKKKNSAAVALGRLGGLKGGPARTKKLTAKQRSASARKAVKARWAKQKAADVNRSTL